MTAPAIRLRPGVTIRPGVTLSAVTQTGGGGGNTYFATQAVSNSGSNAIHIDVSYPWASTVPVGATIVADGIGTFTVVAILTPFEQGNTSGNWFFALDPVSGPVYFPGGTALTFTW